MFGNHQNLPKVKKADPNMAPLNTAEDTVKEEQDKPAVKEEDKTEDELEKERVIDEILSEDLEKEKSKEAIEEMFKLDEGKPSIAEQMDEEETSGEGEEGENDVIFPGEKK